jgi:hypothetical protein
MDFIINTILISIPEEAFIVAFVLIFTGKADFINIKLKNIARFMIPVLIPALTSGFLRIILHHGLDYVTFLTMFLIFVSVALVYEIRGFKKIMQCLGCTIIGSLIPAIEQMAYVPVSMSIMRLTMADINKVDIGVLCFTLPERVIEVLIIAFLLSKKRNILKVNPFRLILSNKIMSIVFFFNLAFNLFFLYIFTYEIYVERILSQLSIMLQLLATMFVILVPIVNMASFIGIVYMLAYREKSRRMFIVEETKAVSALISVLSRRGNYTQIQDELKDFNKQMKEIEKTKY